MSYCVTDAGEADLNREFQILERLNEEIDQLASQAMDCSTLAPHVQCALDLAWFFSEQAMREVGHGSCGHLAIDQQCPCCEHYRGLMAVTQALRSNLT